MFPTPSRLLAGALCGVVIFAGCNRGDNADIELPADTVQAGGQAALSDGEVMHAVLTAAEVGGATAAQGQAAAQHADVERFAQVLRADQAALQQAFAELAGRNDFAPAESEVSQELRAVAERVTERARGATGAAVDEAFLQGEIEFYQALVDAVDSRLLASVRSDELRGMLRDARPTWEAHLQRAVQLRSQLAYAPALTEPATRGATQSAATPPASAPPATPPPPVRDTTVRQDTTVRRDTLVRQDTLARGRIPR